ncbi:MAG: class II aldolase/adducin family protein [Candidatus Bathyarchaeia archaeon]
MGKFPPSPSEEKLKEEICKVMRRLFNRGLVSALSGNISARLPGANEFWITPSGIFKGEIEPEDLLKVNLDGKVISGFLKPSVETPFHAVIYRKRADVNAIIHSHNPIATGLALAGIEIKPVTVESAIIVRKVKIVPWAPPGTDKLANLIGEYIGDSRALILMNHGVVGIGRDLLEAEAIVEALEESSMIQFIASLFRRDLPVIPEEDIKINKENMGV